MQPQLNQIIRRFPKFELSYEIISHKKVSNDYNLAIAIPSGKKQFAWFTFCQDRDICYLFDLNKDKQINTGNMIEIEFDTKLAYGTIVYGTIVLHEITGHSTFVIEDIYFYKGISMKSFSFGEKLEFIDDFMHSIQTSAKFSFLLPVMWNVFASNDNEYSNQISEEIINVLGYSAHHIQYRTMNNMMPYLNVHLNRKFNANTCHTESSTKPVLSFENSKCSFDYSKPQYRYPTIFQVTADVQFDIYHLFACGKNKLPVYYDIAYVPNYKSSIFLNGIFRNIRENKNIDYIEESDDEDDFENIAEDKYVDIHKICLMECVFHSKFKRWIPTQIVTSTNNIIHISKLVK